MGLSLGEYQTQSFHQPQDHGTLLAPTYDKEYCQPGTRQSLGPQVFMRLHYTGIIG